MNTSELMHGLFNPGGKEIILPSRFQVNDKVLFSFGSESVFARVLAVKFTASKVKYDIAIQLSGEEHRFYHIESDFVHPLDESVPTK